MPKLCAIIRCTGESDDSRRLIEELAPIFGRDIFLVIDRYRETDRPEILVEGNKIIAGRAFLDRRGLPFFEKIGWQCGDIAYYVAAEALKDYEYFFMIEDDVSFRYQPGFFSEFLKLDFDAALAGLAQAPGGWLWTKTMAHEGDAAVYKAFFPVSCLSRKVILTALKKRQEYSKKFTHFDMTSINYNYANDEVLVATAAVNAGFRVKDMASLFPNQAFSACSLDYAIHKDELSFMRDRIVHPVCSGAKSRQKYANLMSHFSSTKPALARRLAEFSNRLGRDKWLDFTGISPDAIESREGTGDVGVDLLNLNPPLAAKLKAMQACEFNSWIYESKILVFDFSTAKGAIAIDIFHDPELAAYKVEVFARRPDADEAMKRLSGDLGPGEKLAIGNIPTDMPLSAKTDLACRLISEVLSKIAS